MTLSYSNPFETFYSAIKAKSKISKPNSDGWFQACCPAHNDRSPSLSFKDMGNFVRIHCHSGCHALDVLKALNLTHSDLMPNAKDYQYSDREYRDQIKEYKYKRAKGESLSKEDIAHTITALRNLKHER